MDETPILQVDWGQLQTRDAEVPKPLVASAAPAPVECELCLEELPSFDWPGKRFVTTCVGCGYRCCTTCLERAFFARPTLEPCCANDACRIETPRYVVVRCFDKACLARMRSVGEAILLDIERAKFPAALRCAELFAGLAQLFALQRMYNRTSRPAHIRLHHLEWVYGRRDRTVERDPRADENRMEKRGYTPEDVAAIKGMIDRARVVVERYAGFSEDVSEATRVLRCLCPHRVDGIDGSLRNVRTRFRRRATRAADGIASNPLRVSRLRAGTTFVAPSFDLRAELAAKPLDEVSQAEHFATVGAFIAGRSAPDEYEVLRDEEVADARKRRKAEHFERVGYTQAPGATTADAQDHETVAAEQVYRCPAVDCGGFLSTGSWTCLKCKALACRTCLCLVAPSTADDEERRAARRDHECDPDTVLTVRVLRKDTKACPQCGFRIVRSAGCDVMFCTQCHTGFHWRTGEILAAVRVHNPHFFEWAQRQRLAAVAAGRANGADGADGSGSDGSDDEGPIADEDEQDFPMAYARPARHVRRRGDEDLCNPNQLIQRKVRSALERISMVPAFAEAYDRLPPGDRMSVRNAPAVRRFGRRFRGNLRFRGRTSARLSVHVYGLLNEIGNIEDAARQLAVDRRARPLCPTCAEAVDVQDRNFDLRVRHLAGALSEPDFKRLLYERMRNEKLEVATGQLRQMFASVFAQACVKLARDHRRDKTNFAPVLEFSREVRALIDHCNAKWTEIHRSFDRRARPFCALDDRYMD